jgi:glycosyltransferase involved in cell wall biosynthesis
MRILISVNTIGIGGAEIFALKLAHELSKKHTVFLYDREPELRREDIIEKFAPGIKIINKSISEPLRFLVKFVGWVLRKLHAKSDFYLDMKGIYLRNRIRKYNIQLISSHTLHSDYFICNSLLKRNIPIVMTMHGCYEGDQGVRYAEHVNLVLKRINAIIYLTAKNLLRIENLKSLEKKIPIKKIYNGHPAIKVSHKITREELFISDSAIIFVMVARGIPEKGWEIAIDAFKKLQNNTVKDVCLLLVGDSEYVQKLKRKEEKNAKIIFRGYSVDPADEINISDVGILASYTECLPNSVVEYLLCRKPVIASDVGEISFMIEDQNKNKAGFIVPINREGKPDVDILFKSMLEYVQQPGLILSHSKIATRAASKFDMDTCTGKYEDLFQQLISSYPDNQTLSK